MHGSEIFRLRHLLPLVGGLLLLFSSCGEGGGPAGPDSESSGRIDVRVLSLGTGLPGVSVSLQGPRSGEATTDGAGMATYRSLPPGTYSVTISGYPSAAFFPETSSSVSVRSAGHASVIFEGNLLEITTSSLEYAVVGQAYSAELEATGGSGSYTWAVAEGELLPGLTLSAAGVISDTPSASGTRTFTVQVTSGGATATRELSLTVLAAGSEGFGIGFGPEQFVLIPAGTFQMGDQSGVGQSDELPVHTVTITQPFYLQKTEVTQGQWLAVMGDNPSAASSCGETCPVESVRERDILTFISHLNARDPGKDYRLPTEAEWEYAARAGTTGEFGGTGVVDEMGWYARNSGTALHLVAQLQPNAWGLYDMHGNVHEYVQDWYAADYYDHSPAEDPPGPSVGSYRALRGGSWFDPAENLRSASRMVTLEIARVRHGVGFRLARSNQ